MDTIESNLYPFEVKNLYCYTSVHAAVTYYIIMTCKLVGMILIRRFVTENQVAPDNFRLNFSPFRIIIDLAQDGERDSNEMNRQFFVAIHTLNFKLLHVYPRHTYTYRYYYFGINYVFFFLCRDVLCARTPFIFRFRHL